MKSHQSSTIIKGHKDVAGFCIVLQSLLAIGLAAGLTYLFLVSEIFS